MNNDPNEFLIRLLEGRIPESVPDTDPAGYARILLLAIDYHEEQRLSADYDRAFNEEWLEFLEEEALPGSEACEAERILAEQCRREIDVCVNRISEAGSRKEACENMLMILLRDHPELKNRLETEELP